jgi:hypothetical protein
MAKDDEVSKGEVISKGGEQTYCSSWLRMQRSILKVWGFNERIW